MFIVSFTVDTFSLQFAGLCDSGSLPCQTHEWHSQFFCGHVHDDCFVHRVNILIPICTLNVRETSDDRTAWFFDNENDLMLVSQCG